MPIHPDDKARYPSNWKEISDGIRFGRADSRCECRGECGIEHDPDPTWGYVDHRCGEVHGTKAVNFKGNVVLTVAHVDHTPENCDPKNLRAMCQRFDVDHHRETRQRRRREAETRAGQQTMDFD